jgi:ribosomal protein L15E
VKKDKVIYHVAGNQDQPVKRFQIPLVPQPNEGQEAQGRSQVDLVVAHAGRESGDRKRKREGGVSTQRWRSNAAARLSGLTRSAAARRLHGHDDAATIAATTNISRFSSVRDRVEKANGMAVIQAIELNIYTLRTLRSDEAAGYIALVRTSDRISDLSVRDTEGDDLLSAEIHMDGSEDFFMSIPNDDFSD